MSTEEITTEEDLDSKIENGEFTLYDKLLYGGIGYGYICLPRNIIRVILSVLFPPFGIVLHHLELKDEFPYITFTGLINLVNNIGDVIWSVFLTFLFWVPGVIYSFQKLKVLGATDDVEKFKDNYGIHPDELSDKMVKEFMNDIRNRKKFGL
jgi:uncharacterized membrane protein YqaE (UPF0057 family)